MIGNFAQPLPTPDTQVLDPGGALANLYYFLLKALHQRTGGNSGVLDSVGANLTAGTAANPLVLGDDINEILNGGSATSVKLASLQVGQAMMVYCGLGSSINVYPFDGGQIDGLGINQPYSLANGKMQIFTAFSVMNSGGIQYRSFQLG